MTRKVYVVVIQNKDYQEIGNVHNMLEAAEKEAAELEMNSKNSCGLRAFVVEKDYIFTNFCKGTVYIEAEYS